ncbi:GDP-mannose 4,6-dehydratase [Sulfurimonas gotlandica GD1]|uniref:GDP-mannose 4,6-dehydratase n=1 Tax=Sulfurimonas gotlandica (strain DSM 19862 / JCM 16533 / GD1) TaxID=929558 RepID=B6BKG4_SULGG|nr:GDP-mannose 4,6-dehydratase [Sulfurimonas gotlandica]EDZ62301.1 GDP-mannose 4,6-dehydratase [Sulfurimonas gotlandica GD1]EHP29019.1 GDP-mannose 4,6-dehydratase [Sulfurimonas gotlandica GD1]
MKKALITGVTGQDGAYLSKLLLEKGYEVIGLTRSYAAGNLYKLEYLGIQDSITILECDLLDFSNILNVITKNMPDEIYNLSAQSSVGSSFDQPIGTFQYNTTSVLNILESIKLVNKNIKFYQASSSEMYGKVKDLPISEDTPFHPLSPYAVSKASAHWLTINYRESYSMFTCCGILFNHESFLRSKNFFIKKIIKDSIDIYFGKKDILKVGNIEIKRDFGYSPKYIEAMYSMMQQETPEDFVICSGESVSLKEIIFYVFDKLKIEHEKLVIDDNLYRPTEIYDIYGSNKKAKEKLKWNYDNSFIEVLDMLIEEELINYEK